jgi:glycosyltransferase involved in cell wall biosynthesis
MNYKKPVENLMLEHKTSLYGFKIAVISYDFIEDSKNSRPLLIYKAIKCSSMANIVTVYCANFSHHKKKHVTYQNPDFQAISVSSYTLNISLKRILSYTVFAAKVLFHPDIKKYDILYFCVPANELAIVALLYKLCFKKSVVLDVVDIWPDAFPLPSWINPFFKGLFFLTSSRLRNGIFRSADLILTQSAYFKQKLNFPKNCKVVLMGTTQSLDSEAQHYHRPSLGHSINILYLGSINAINDLKSLITILANLKMRKKVHLSVVGGGKKLGYLQREVERIGISSYFLGICFEESIKREEFLRCHFGYNGYVKSTEVAISYKSLEYLSHGLPLLNSTKIGTDTYDLIQDNGCGFNFSARPSSLANLVDNLTTLTDDQYYEMQQKALQTFQDHFSWDVFRNNLDLALSDFDLRKVPNSPPSWGTGGAKQD